MNQIIKPKWLEIAEEEIKLGVSEIKGAQHNERILLYHEHTSLKAMQDEVPWCSSFVNFCLYRAGVQGTNQANARSFLKWGTEINLKHPAHGSIIILKRGKSSWQGHVAFLVGVDKSFFYCLGGNQSDKVSISRYNKEDLLGFRWPKQI